MLPIGLSLSLSLSPSPSLRCGDGVCGQKGRGSHSLERCWLHFSTSDKMIERHLIKRIKPQKAKTPEFYPSAHVDTAHGADNTIGTPLILFFWGGKCDSTQSFSLFFFVSATALFIVRRESDLWTSLAFRLPHWWKLTIIQEPESQTGRSRFLIHAEYILFFIFLGK